VVTVISYVQELIRKKVAGKGWWVLFLLLKLLHCQIYEKKVIGRVCQKCNVWYHEIWVDAKGKRQFICGRCHWSELYHQMIGIVLRTFSISCKAFWFF
jgi:hypothetical protein